MRYKGPADILTSDGTVIAKGVRVKLRDSTDPSGLREWGGTVPEASDLTSRVLDGSHRLRLPDGSEGEIVFTLFRELPRRIPYADFVGAGSPPSGANPEP